MGRPRHEAASMLIDADGACAHVPVHAARESKVTGGIQLGSMGPNRAGSTPATANRRFQSTAWAAPCHTVCSWHDLEVSKPAKIERQEDIPRHTKRWIAFVDVVLHHVHEHEILTALSIAKADQ